VKITASGNFYSRNTIEVETDGAIVQLHPGTYDGGADLMTPDEARALAVALNVAADEASEFVQSQVGYSNSREAAFFKAIRELHRDAGGPSSRSLASVAGVSHTTVAGMLRGSNFPRWRTAAAVITALGHDAADFKDTWSAAAKGRDSRHL